MIVLSNSATQTIQPGQAITFDRVVTRCSCGECWSRQIPQSVKLCKKGCHMLSFSGNITSATANVSLQLAIAVVGQPLVETAMNATPPVANQLMNVSALTAYNNNCCDADRISVINAGTTPITVAQNSSFVIE